MEGIIVMIEKLNEKAKQFFELLGYDSNVYDNLVNGKVMYTQDNERPELRDANPDMMETIKKIEEKGDYRVVHIVKKQYSHDTVYSVTEPFDLEIYIIQLTIPEGRGKIIYGDADLPEGKGYEVYCYIKNLKDERASGYQYCILYKSKGGVGVQM